MYEYEYNNGLTVHTDPQRSGYSRRTAPYRCIHIVVYHRSIMAQPRKICPYCNRPMVLKGELKDATRGTCNCELAVPPLHLLIELNEEEYIFQQFTEA